MSKVLKAWLAALVCAASVVSAHAAGDGGIVTGSAAFGGWKQNAPGRKLLIRPSDMPAPMASRSASNAPGLVERPAGAKPKVMEGFSVSRFAGGLEQPRVIAIAPGGDVFVADSGSGKIHVYRMAEDGTAAGGSVFASGLDRPYGIAFHPPGPDPHYVYVANTGSVVRFPYRSGDRKARGPARTVVAGLPTGHHWTRDLAFSKDGRTMFVSVGSGSNDARGTMPSRPPKGFVAGNPPGAAWGEERWRADVLAFDPEGGHRRIVATGLRNCSGMTVQPATGDLWCVVNERDMLGDDLPPDYATRVRDGQFYGWPWYYIGDRPDPRWKAAPRPDLADGVTVPDILFQAHSAPLGIGFYTGGMFPSEYEGDAFVAMHGSWNRGRRTGYKVVRLIFKDGKPTGVYQDFMTGFVVDGGKVWGRPVDATMAEDGSLLVSDDGSGTVWRVRFDR